MFESKEEVSKAIMDLKLFEDMDSVAVGNEKEDADRDLTEETINQIFPSHDAISDRFCKTLYYGKQPATDRPSLAFTNIAVDEFTNVGLDALGEKLGRLDMNRAADITRNACAGPNSLVLALLYLDKLRRRNPDYLTTVSSADLFLVSLMVASKFLHDDGEEDEVFNDEWASSGGIDTKELNRLEISFLSALDWRIYVSNQDFDKAVEKVETDIAFKEVSKRGWASYTDLDVLSMNSEIQHLLNTFITYTLKMTAVCVAAYAAGIVSLLGTTALLQKTPLGPEAVSSSMKTLSSAMSSGHDNHDIPTIKHRVPEFDDSEDEITTSYPHVSPADLISASLLVTSLTASVSNFAETHGKEKGIEEQMKEEKAYDIDLDVLKMNQSRAEWLAEYSKKDIRLPGDNWDKGHFDDVEKPSVFKGLGDLHLLKERKGTGPADNLGLAWTNLMSDGNFKETNHEYNGKCPVLKWSNQLRTSGLVAETGILVSLWG